MSARQSSPAGTRAVVVLVVVTLGVGVTGPPVTAQAEEGTVVGRPAITVSAQDSELRVGERNTLEVLVANDGDINRGGPAEYVDRVTTARNVRLSVAEDRLDDRLAQAIDVRTGTVLVGSLGQGVAGPYDIELDVAETLPPGEYEIPVRVTYDYTAFVEYGPGKNPTYGDSSRTETVVLDVVVEDRPRFEVSAIQGEGVTAGTTETVGLTLRNVGGEPARNVRTTLSGADSPLYFGEGDSTSERVTTLVERLDAGERTRIEVPVGTARETTPGTYPLVATTEYEDTRGVTRTTPATEVAVPVRRRQSFSLSVSDAALQVGQEGTVSGTVTNTGERAVEEAVLVLEDVPAGLTAQNVEVPLGTIPAGGNATFTSTIAASNRTSAGPRQLGFRVRYRDAGGERRTSDRLETAVALAREQTFAVTDLSSTLRVGSTGTVSGTVVNTGDSPVANASVQLLTDDGLTPRATEYAVGDIAPGVSIPFEFTVDVANGTAPGPRSIGLRVRYRDSSDDSRVSDRIDGRVSVGTEQSFRVRDTSQSLRVGERGLVRGVVTNTGETTVSEAVVVFDSDGPLTTQDREFVVGTLRPGGSAPFEFTVDVANRTTPGPRQVEYRVRYRETSGERRTSDRVATRVDIGAAPAFAVQNLTTALRVGQPGTVSGTLTNTGETTVSNAVLEFVPGAPTLSPRTTDLSLGRLEPGESVPFEFTVDVANRTSPGTLPATFRVRYSDRENVTRRSDPIRQPLAVSREQTFALLDVGSSLRVGQRGTVSGTVVNTGPGDVTDASITVGTSGDLQPTAPTVALGDLAAGESAPFAVTVAVPNGSDATRRVFPARISYRGDFGERLASDELDAAVSVGGEQTFDVTNLSSTLRVDWTGTVSGTVVNTGDSPVSNAVVEFTGDTTLRPRAGEHALGDIAPGESVSFDFTVDVANHTTPGPRFVPFRVRYRTGGEVYRSDPVDGRVTVGPEHDPLSVDPVEASVPVDGDSVLVVRVRNRLDEPLTDVRGQLTVSPPFETEDTSAFAGELGPNESALLRFDLSTTDEAIPKTDSVRIGVSFRDARGDRRTADPAVVPVRIREPSQTLPVVPIAVALLAVLGAGIWWWRRR